ncbi:efflux RND transporter periplasmic adaptor subunit [bacterium]|nr:efflux RND transporter periplasmic adaptor subunit [bacterium]MCI0606125.1 efflux RND transporter periplasmic adaptor subunit [bacterium]
MIKRHPVISILLVVMIVAGLFFAFRSQNANASPKAEKVKEQPKEEKKQPVEVAQAKTGTITSSLVTTATLDPDRQVTMIAETTGVVNRITVDEGDMVREGQLLATLSVRDKQVKLQQTNVRVQNAKQELDRKQASFNAKIISESEFEKAKYELQVAIEDRNAAQVELDRSVINAPFSGVITQRFIEKGQNINTQSQLFTIVDADPLEAKVYLPEKEILGVKGNQSVALALNAQKDVTFQGTIRQINPVVDPKTGTIKVTVEVTKAPAVVRPGSFVDVKLETQRHDNALLIPKKALMEEAGERFVFVVQKDKAARRTVSVGFLDDQNAEILSGVNKGDMVVTSGQGSLRDGSKTEIVAKNKQR